ncbi:hypothetical protein [Nocardioides pacificus]
MTHLRRSLTAIPRWTTSLASARAAAWSVQSQQGSRRNAMIASTALAQRRAELNEVEEYLAAVGEASLPLTSPEDAATAAHG